ncbi:MAG: hypothetical protein H6662_12825 [Ardenticatenaceae bacterium]|nr:hypothetical protein [Anaerolineales bacterium]MCB8922462.1 hypothetical protein [Ardenticatenaceae bacterium]MCB8989931.1 hypothetical protein [Ardenticatenaceae bacterium]
MKQQCENCGQPVLSTDTVCWHCGWKLATEVKAEPPPTEKPRKVLAAQPTQANNAEPYQLTAIAVYGTLTLLLIVALLLVMRSLGRQPLVTVNADTRLGNRWIPVTGTDQSFTLDLPQGWAWLDVADGQFATTLAESVRWETAVYPLHAIAEDADLLLLAGSGDTVSADDGFVVVARSQRLSVLTPEQAQQMVSQSGEEVEVVNTAVSTNLNRAPQAQFTLHLLVSNESLRCQQLFVPQDDAAYLAAACAGDGRYPSLSSSFADILASFQPLN